VTVDLKPPPPDTFVIMAAPTFDEMAGAGVEFSDFLAPSSFLPGAGRGYCFLFSTVDPNLPS